MEIRKIFWNQEQNLYLAVNEFLSKGLFFDCTLSAEAQLIKAHKIVLAASSSYFQVIVSIFFWKTNK